MKKLTMAQCVEKAISLGVVGRTCPIENCSVTELTWSATSFMKLLGELDSSFEERRFLAMEFARIAMEALDNAPYHDSFLVSDIHERIGIGQSWYI